MELQPFIITALSAVMTVIGWFCKSLWDMVSTLKTEISQMKDSINTFKVEVGTNYIRYDRLQDAMKPIMNSLEEIKETLKTKADK